MKRPFHHEPVVFVSFNRKKYTSAQKDMTLKLNLENLYLILNNGETNI